MNDQTLLRTMIAKIAHRVEHLPSLRAQDHERTVTMLNSDIRYLQATEDCIRDLMCVVDESPAVCYDLQRIHMVGCRLSHLLCNHNAQ